MTTHRLPTATTTSRRVLILRPRIRGRLAYIDAVERKRVVSVLVLGTINALCELGRKVSVQEDIHNEGSCIDNPRHHLFFTTFSTTNTHAITTLEGASIRISLAKKITRRTDMRRGCTRLFVHIVV